MRILCCAFCVLCLFAAITYVHLFTVPSEVGRRYLRRVSELARKNIEQVNFESMLAKSFRGATVPSTRKNSSLVNASYEELKGASAPFEPSSGGVGAKTTAREVANHENVNVQTTYSWRFCKFGGRNRSQDLFDQLQCVVKSLHASNESYFIYLGTLIGYARDHGINPYEVDNDIVIEKTLNKPKFAKLLSQCGMIFFKYDIWRACMLSDKPRRVDTPPWKQYFPYTDFYTARFDPFVDWDFHKNYGRLSIVKRPFHGMQISVPSIYPRLLKDRYGNWTKPPKKKKKYGQSVVYRRP